jgi:hypothetical protein
MMAVEYVLSIFSTRKIVILFCETPQLTCAKSREIKQEIEQDFGK